MIVKVRCRFCLKLLDLPVTEEQLAKWKSGVLIQNAIPDLSPEMRELLISGLCGECFNEIAKG